MTDLEETYATRGDRYNGYEARSDHVKRWIKGQKLTDTDTISRFETLLSIESHILGERRGWNSGHMRMGLEQRHPEDWEAIRDELDPHHHERERKQEEERRKLKEQEEEQRAKGIKKDLEKLKSAWQKQGGV